ncbi:hypothetical protein Pcinc_038676 [Petrolisthes cinctipes]|uniref:Uncharacterized protein n=1 Tax=Petrolisthes cinctipes TaxID=88211 RepID=A0AAE1BQ28_PETCI|nr:hypothetical protein Pcinc_038676 [Petrolisthes cinctipes]
MGGRMGKKDWGTSKGKSWARSGERVGYKQGRRGARREGKEWGKTGVQAGQDRVKEGGQGVGKEWSTSKMEGNCLRSPLPVIVIGEPTDPHTHRKDEGHMSGGIKGGGRGSHKHLPPP